MSPEHRKWLARSAAWLNGDGQKLRCVTLTQSWPPPHPLVLLREWGGGVVFHKQGAVDEVMGRRFLMTCCYTGLSINFTH